jgi:long-subunit fatty acid transport protein
MGADYQATEKLSIDASITYNQAEASMESISLTEPFTPTGVLEAFYSDFEDRIGLVENYSDLEYTQIDISIGGSYDFTDRLYATASATYSDTATSTPTKNMSTETKAAQPIMAMLVLATVSKQQS